MKLILTAGDLYREIKDRGLELRRGEGRDDALYSELTRNLNMPSMFEHLQDFLDTSQISIETFVELFLTLIEPFAKMYQDIYSCMQRFDARKANQFAWFLILRSVNLILILEISKKRFVFFKEPKG
jgi:hypothetical protein